MIDLSTEILVGVRKLKARLRLVAVPCDGNPEFKTETIIGPLHVRPMDDWLACRFIDVAAAAKHFNVTAISEHRLNPYSGKWNWHWFDHIVPARHEGRMHVTAGAENMLSAFAVAVEKLLPPADSVVAFSAEDLLQQIAHMRVDGDDFFPEEMRGGADITNDHLQDQLTYAVIRARTLLGITESGPTRKPTKVPRST